MGKRWLALALLIWNCRDPSGSDQNESSMGGGAAAGRAQNAGESAGGADAGNPPTATGGEPLHGGAGGLAGNRGSAAGACSDGACPSAGASGSWTFTPQGGSDTSGGGVFAGAGSDGQAGAAGAATEELKPCELLDPVDSVDASAAVGHDYVNALVNNCRYQGVVCELAPADAIDFRNSLAKLAYLLWGCSPDRAGAFNLVPQAVRLSQSDAQTLITLYLDQMEAWTLPLSARQRQALQDELWQLAQSRLSTDATSIDRCDSPCFESASEQRAFWKAKP